MKKRILCLLLSILLAAAALPAGALAAEETAPAGMQTSEAGIEMIKRFEGFSSRPMIDGSQWSIGYGNACDPSDYPYGITEEGADRLLRESLTYFEESLNRYLDRYGIQLTQNQFDAIVSITYNLGVAWINSSYRFWTILRDGITNYTDNEIASAMGVWCHVGTSVSVSLLQRRIQEAQLFLYGDYTGEESAAFHYLILDGGGGTVDTDVMLYREGERYLVFTEAERPGYYFAGWYTAPQGGGERLLPWSRVERSGAVYAHWSLTPVAEPQPPAETDPPAAGVFPDVQESDWFHAYVESLADAGVISGYSDGLYRPAEAVTTGQALKLILLAAGYPEQPAVSTHWASGYRSFALQQRFVFDGELDGLDEPIRRETMAKLAASALGVTGGGVPSVFSDTASDHVMALYQLGILEGSIDPATGSRLFHPNETTTRAEIAKVVWLIYNR